LTSAGEKFLATAEQMESAFLHAQAEIGDKDVELTGIVRIGAPDGFSTYYLAAALRDFVERHPAIVIQLVPIPQVIPLARREVDIVVVLDKPEAGRFVARKLTDYSLGIYASAAYLKTHGTPRAVADLATHRLIGYVEEHAFSTALNYVRELFEEAPTSFECASAVTQLEALRVGLGIGSETRAARTARGAQLLDRHPRRHARPWPHPRRARSSGGQRRARSGDVHLRLDPLTLKRRLPDQES
jgi:DNA-binding transcriptional LysR family regulator